VTRCFKSPQQHIDRFFFPKSESSSSCQRKNKPDAKSHAQKTNQKFHTRATLSQSRRSDSRTHPLGGSTRWGRGEQDKRVTRCGVRAGTIIGYTPASSSRTLRWQREETTNSLSRRMLKRRANHLNRGTYVCSPPAMRLLADDSAHKRERAVGPSNIYYIVYQLAKSSLLYKA
jgi:hypothetical protein